LESAPLAPSIAIIVDARDITVVVFVFFFVVLVIDCRA